MTNRSSGQERRQSSRVSVDLWVEERTGEATYFQRATNLSPGGVFLHGTLPHAPGTRVALDLRLSTASERAVAVEGEVVVSTGARGMGIRFVNLSESARASIEAACRRTGRRSRSAAGRDRHVA